MILPIFLSIALSQPFANAASSQPSNITSSTCVDSSGYTSCYNKANSAALNCFSGAGTDELVQQSCACELYMDEIQCALESCWNQVYSCEYQSLATTFLSTCTPTTVPFFPAPDNAPGRCSCNLGYVFYNTSNSFVSSCINAPTADTDKTFACTCCSESAALTSVLEICPDTDPTLLGYNTVNEELSAYNVPFDQCGPYFEEYNCVNDMGYTPIGTIPFLSSAPATTGTATLSNIAGSITAPVSGATFTWTGSGVSRVITASDAKNAGAGASKQSSTTESSGAAATSGTDTTAAAATATATGSGSTSASASAAKATSSSSASTQGLVGSHAVVVGLSLVALTFL